MANIGKLTAHIGADTRGLTTGLATGQRALGGFARMATRVLAPIAALTIGAGGIMALVGVMTSATEAGTSFEKTMATVGGVMRATASEQRNLTAAAREMGEVTEYAATQAAESLQFLGMAGFEADKAIKALPGTLDLATAGGIDLGRAADIATNALTAMGLQVEELGRVNDVFVGTITRSNTNMEMMAESFKYAAPLARAYGYSIEELSGLIGTLGNAGIQGSMAGTQLAMAMLKANAIAKEFGFTSSDLIDVLDAMRKAGFTAGQVIEKFGGRAGRAAGVLFAATTEAKAFQEQLGDVGGEAKDLADIMRDTMWGIRKELTSVIESLKIDMYKQWREELVSTLKSIIDWIRDNKAEIIVFTKIAVRTFVDMATAIKDVVTYLYDMDTAIRRVLSALPFFPDVGMSLETIASLQRITDEINALPNLKLKAFNEELEKMAETLTDTDKAALAIFADIGTLFDPTNIIHTAKAVNSVTTNVKKLAQALGELPEMAVMAELPRMALPEPVTLEQQYGGILEVIDDFNEHQAKSAAMALVSIQEQYDLHAEWLESWAGKVSGAMSAAFENFFFDAITGKMKSLGDYLTSFMNSIARIVSQKLATSFVEKLIPGFQHGGIVRQPTLAMVGERGPEAVIPLDRLERAGVPSREERPINMIVNVNTPDVGSFKSSQTQIATQMAAVLTAARRNM